MKYVLFLSLLCSSFFVISSTKTDMRDILDNFIKLLPYTTDQAILDKKKIMTSLNKIEESLKDSKHMLLAKTPTFKSNFNFINENINHIRKGLELKHTFYAKSQMKQLVSNCISCHSQLPNTLYNKIPHNYSKEMKAYLKTPESLALFQYFLRDYKSAIKSLKQELYSIKYPLRQKRSILLILKLYLTNLKDEKAAISFLNELDFKKLVFKDKNLINDWKKQLDKWIKQDKTKSLATLIKTKLDPIEDKLKIGNRTYNEIILFIMQGRIQDEVFATQDKDLGASGLYWLGLIENSAPTLYSLGDHYLKDCIRNHPGSPYAKKSFIAYEQSVYFGYSGSSGTHIPEDVLKELKDLKTLTNRKIK